MKKPSARYIAVLAGTALMAGSLTACAGSDEGASPSATKSVNENAPVTITIGDFPSSDQAERVKFVQGQVDDFMKKYPNITVKTDTAQYSPDTFAAELAGGTLPDVLAVPFTEPQGLIRNKQVADLTDALTKLGIKDELNPRVLANVSDKNGRVFGVPDWTYAVGLGYNRSLFEKAGLDPNKPPATWDEVRSAAKTIHDKTGVPGFGMMASGNGGGWSLTALTYAFGGTMESEDGSASALAKGPSAEALKTLRGMQEDGSFHQNLLLDFSGNMWQEYSAGKFAMALMTGGEYQSTVVNNGFPAKDFGLTILPTTPNGNGTLTGGALRIVKADLTPEQVLAAVKWINFSALEPQLDEKAAVENAKSSAADKLPVGVPGLSVFSDAKTEEYASWIKPYVNVPVENFQPWVDRIGEQKLVAEPPTKAQDVYKLLDVLVQKVLSDRSADIDALVADYDKQLNGLLSR